MTVSIRVMSAGDGCKYLLRTVAAGDGDRDLSTPLTRYYNADGTPPGRWMGSGLPTLGSGQLRDSDEVTEAQLQLLIGMGRDALTGVPLWRAYPAYKSVTQRVEERVGTLHPKLGPNARSRAVAAIEAAESERGTRRAVAAYDFTFSILVNLPGESSSVVTCIDGHQMAKKGRAGPALAAAGLGSFFAGCVGTVMIAAFAPALTEVAFKFGPAEYFALMVLGLIGAVVLASGSLLKAVAMILLGLLLGLVGTDVNSGVARFSFDVPELTDGIGFVAIAMGIFGYGEIISNLAQREEQREVFAVKVQGLFPTKQDFKDMTPAVLRGTALGCALGILPGGGALLSAFAAYTIEKKVKARPGEVPFGEGNIRGVAGPEAANNAGAQASFIPLLTLGIPSNVVMALMVGAMTIHNIQPGPQVMTSNPELFWGLIASMWIGNAMLVILNLPLIGIWIKLLTVPYRFLFPAIVLFCAIGVYSTNNNTWDIWVVGVFGVIGYIFNKLRAEPAPLLLGLILGPMMEENLRRALLLSRGDWSTFVTRPLSAGLLVACVLLLLVVLLPSVRKTREVAFVED